MRKLCRQRCHTETYLRWVPAYGWPHARLKTRACSAMRCSARDRDLAQGQWGGVPLADREPARRMPSANPCSGYGALAQYERALIQERVASHLRTFALVPVPNSRSAFSSMKYAVTESGAAQPRRPRLHHRTQGRLALPAPASVARGPLKTIPRHSGFEVSCIFVQERGWGWALHPATRSRFLSRCLGLGQESHQLAHILRRQIGE
ncbi:hypothetical protein SAMN05216330_10638 [Bradyrhizobium sp. Ghvi]|nr:hypothetical protein SAMN05216330_10638 [Bradyrhizobium sp. Ghvi]